MLPARVFAPLSPNPAPEDFFAMSLSMLFTDDTRNSHGLPGHSVTYTSPRFGDIKLGIPEHPDTNEGRLLFAHYLWNAGVMVADAIESASNRNSDEHPHHDTAEKEEVGKVKWNREFWDVKDQDVLELGAGTALPSLISGLCGARSVTITDHPSSPALVTDTIARNVRENLKIDPQSTDLSDPDLSPKPEHSTVSTMLEESKDTSSPLHTTCHNISIHGLVWGNPAFQSTTTYGKLSRPQPEHSSFDKIIIADCLWMSSQHANIVKTINKYLRRPVVAISTCHPSAPENIPCALVVAGYHTGRDVVARFFKIATGSRTGAVDNDGKAGGISSSGITGGHNNEDDEEKEGEDMDEDAKEIRGTLRAAEIFEVDVDCNVREWLPDRPRESREQAKRWCVCAALAKR